MLLERRMKVLGELSACTSCKTGRHPDDSLNTSRYVLPNHHLFALVEHPPVNAAKVLTVVRPTPPLVQARATELFKVILDAIDPHKRSEAERVQVAKAVHSGMDIDSGPFANIVVPDEASSGSKLFAMLIPGVIS